MVNNVHTAQRLQDFLTGVLFRKVDLIPANDTAKVTDDDSQERKGKKKRTNFPLLRLIRGEKIIYYQNRGN